MTINRADWKSLHAEGALALAKGATLPTGHVALRMTRLDDLRRLTGRALTGSIDADVGIADTGGLTVVAGEDPRRPRQPAGHRLGAAPGAGCARDRSHSGAMASMRRSPPMACRRGG